MINSGELSAVRIHRRLKVKLSAVDAILNGGTANVSASIPAERTV
jgi:hypothetical protein